MENQIVWKKIFKGEKYLASNIGGMIKNELTGKILKQRWKAPTKELFFAGKTYCYVKLTLKNGINKEYLVHKLVAIAHIPNPENKDCVNHKDGNRSNNDKSNLNWMTYSENNFHKHAMNREIKRIEYQNQKEYPF